MVSKTVNTVLGPVDANKLGNTLMHEHFFFGYAGYHGNSLYSAKKTTLFASV